MIGSPWVRAVTSILFVSGLSGACSGNPAPGESGYPFNLNGTYDTRFEVQGTNYTGTMIVSTAPGGVVTGSVLLTSPAEVIGDIEGTVADSTFVFESTYTRDGGCGGLLTGTGGIRAEGATSSGTIEIADDCAGGIMEGTYSVIRPSGD